MTVLPSVRFAAGLLAIAAGFTLAFVPSAVAAGTTVYAGGNGVFRSTDGGATWSSTSTGLGSAVVRSFAIDPTNPAVIYAGTSAGVFESINGGDSWTAMNTGINLDFAGVTALAIDPTCPATVYARRRAPGCSLRPRRSAHRFRVTDAGELGRLGPTSYLRGGFRAGETKPPAPPSCC